MGVYEIDKLMNEARRLAAEYRRATGKTLAISGEIAISDAIHLLGLEPAPADAEGYDAVRMVDGRAERLQVKARAVFDDTRRPHRLGQLKLDKPWDAALLVLMDENYEPVEIHEASRAALEAALAEATPNKRGTVSVGRFRMIGRCLWSRDGVTDDAPSR
ncbi:MAG: hypothetical protein K2Y51_20860 [Gammaproteobacteria bacterium]|nr:hypothetical protein [Gammaproteobacteria bacterium]